MFKIKILIIKYKNKIYKGPEIPCFLIIKKCANMKTAVIKGKTKVCKL